MDHNLFPQLEAFHNYVFVLTEHIYHKREQNSFIEACHGSYENIKLLIGSRSPLEGICEYCLFI